MKKNYLIWVMGMCCFSIFTLLCLADVWAGENKYLLTKLWQTEDGLKIPESILFDESRDILYVSNINGKPGEKNGRGFISKISLDGTINDLKWVTGLNAPKGMAIFKDHLYVTDIDHIIEIDLNTGKLMNQYKVPGAIFLNDAAADESGNVYFSDSSSKNSVIYNLFDGKITEWLKISDLNRPNGLYVEEKNLLVGNSGDTCLKAVNLENQQIMPLSNVGSGIDGLHPDGKGNYFVSDWRGKTALVTSSGKTIVLMDTTQSKVNSADLEYISKKQLLLIPTFFDNRVVAYKVE